MTIRGRVPLRTAFAARPSGKCANGAASIDGAELGVMLRCEIAAHQERPLREISRRDPTANCRNPFHLA